MITVYNLENRNFYKRTLDPLFEGVSLVYYTDGPIMHSGAGFAMEAYKVITLQSPNAVSFYPVAILFLWVATAYSDCYAITL